MSIDTKATAETSGFTEKIVSRLRQILSRNTVRHDGDDGLTTTERNRENTDRELFQAEWALMSPYVQTGIQALREDVAFIQSSIPDASEKMQKIKTLFSYDDQFFLHYCGDWKSKVPNAQVLTDDIVRRFFFEKAKEVDSKLQL